MAKFSPENPGKHSFRMNGFPCSDLHPHWLHRLDKVFERLCCYSSWAAEVWGKWVWNGWRGFSPARTETKLEIMSLYTLVWEITGKEAPPNFLSKGIYDQFRVPKDPAWNCLCCRSCVKSWIPLASQRSLPTYFWATELSTRSQNGKGVRLLLKLSLELMLPQPDFKMKYIKGK